MIYIISVSKVLKILGLLKNGDNIDSEFCSLLIKERKKTNGFIRIILQIDYEILSSVEWAPNPDDDL